MGKKLSCGALLGECEVLGASLVAKKQEDRGRGGQGRGWERRIKGRKYSGLFGEGP